MADVEIVNFPIVALGAALVCLIGVTIYAIMQRGSLRSKDEQLVVARRRAKVPEDRLVVLRQQREPADLVLRPRADMSGRDVAHVIHVEAEQRAEP